MASADQTELASRDLALVGTKPQAATIALIEYIARWTDRVAGRTYQLVLVGFFFLSVAAIFAFTLEADESWMLLSTYHAFGLPVPQPYNIANPTVTTGGIHLLIHGVLGFITANIEAYPSYLE